MGRLATSAASSLVRRQDRREQGCSPRIDGTPLCGRHAAASKGWGSVVDLLLSIGKPSLTGQTSGPLLSNTVAQAGAGLVVLVNCESVKILLMQEIELGPLHLDDSTASLKLPSFVPGLRLLSLTLHGVEPAHVLAVGLYSGMQKLILVEPVQDSAGRWVVAGQLVRM
jgi:hypothetical protein